MEEVTSETSRLLLSTPGDELRGMQSYAVLRSDPARGEFLIEYQPWPIFKLEGEPPIKFRALDVYGEEIFGFRGETLSGLENGWQYAVKRKEKGLPVMVVKEKVGREAWESFYGAFKKALQKEMGTTIDEFSPDSIEKVVQESRFEYDNKDRPIKKTTYQEVFFTGKTFFPDNKLYTPIEECEYYYDDQGRLRCTADYEFDDEGRMRLEWARLYEYQQVGPDRARVIIRSYSPLRWRDLQGGVCASSVVVKDVNPETKEIVAYAVYEYEDKREGIILDHYNRVKRYPLKQLFQKETPSERMKWPRWRELPQNTSAPSYLTTEDIRTYAQGREIDQIGTRADKEVKIRILYFDEYLRMVQGASDVEAVNFISQLLSGDLYVEHINKDDVKEVMEIAWRMREGKKLALATSFYPSLIRSIFLGYIEGEEAMERIRDFTEDLAGISKRRRLAFIREFREANTNISQEIENTLLILENLEDLPNSVLQDPERFKGVLEGDY